MLCAGMVRETGHAAEQFLRSVAAGQADNLTERDQQAAAALQRVNTCPDWHTDCRYESLQQWHACAAVVAGSVPRVVCLRLSRRFGVLVYGSV